MSKFLRRTLAILLGCSSAVALAGEWPRFMGPSGTGVVEGEKISHAWPDGKPAELWKINIGEGFGGAAIAGGKVFFLDRNREKKQDVFRVIDLKTAAPIWEHAYPANDKSGSYNGSRSTPTVDGDLVYAVGVGGNLNCFDIANKKVAWSKSLQADFGVPNPPWGFALSPLVVRNMLIISTAGGPAGLVALDKLTGEVLWKSAPFGAVDTYNSPMLVSIAGKEQIAMWHKGVFAAVDPADGKVLWTHEWRVKRPIPQPIFMGDNRFFLTTGYGNGCTMLKVEQVSEKWTVTEIFQDTRSGSKVSPALLYKGHIYTNSDDNKKGLQCLDSKGEVKWETQNHPEFGLGSLIIADGVIFIVNGTTGELVMAEANPAEYKELGRAKLLGGKDIWAPLALSDGLLVIRDQSQMKCLQVGIAQ